MLALFIILIKKDKVQLFQALGQMLSYHHSIPSTILGTTGSEKLSNLSEGTHTVSKRGAGTQAGLLQACVLLCDSTFTCGLRAHLGGGRCKHSKGWMVVECATPSRGKRGEGKTSAWLPISKNNKLTTSDRAEAHQGFGLILGRCWWAEGARPPIWSEQALPAGRKKAFNN